MDVRSSAMIVGLYTAGAVIVFGVAIGYYAHQRSATDAVKAGLADRRTAPVPRRPPLVAGRAAVPGAAGNPSLFELQAALRATREKLDKSTAALNQKNAECKALKDELDQSFLLLFNLLQDGIPAEAEKGDPQPDARTQLNTELEHLKQSLGKSEQLDEERERQLAQLQLELAQADFGLALLHEQAQEELDLLTREKTSVEGAAAAVIAKCGAAAIPALIELLSDERVEVRRWSVKALGALGSEAQDVRPFLEEMLTDPDEVVRSNAQDALTAIGDVPGPTEAK